MSGVLLALALCGVFIFAYVLGALQGAAYGAAMKCLRCKMLGTHEEPDNGG